MKHFPLNILVSMIAALAAIQYLAADQTLITDNMVGTWEGTTHPIVIWCSQKTIPVRLTFTKDGTISGSVGDALLQNGNLKKKHRWGNSENKNRTQFIIEGKLEGPILDEEGIIRSHVFIHIRFEENHIVGSLATNGSKTGGKESMIFTTTSLDLQRCQGELNE